jgi:hypothetical protein
MAPTDTLLESLSGALDASSASLAVAVPGLSDAALCDHLDAVEQLGRRVDALRIAAAAEVDARSRRELGDESLSRRHACPTGAALVSQITRVSAGEASRRVRVGRALALRTTLTGEVLPAEFALVAEAVASGRMGVEAAAAVIRHLDEASRSASLEELRIAEAHLVATAETNTADFVAAIARGWRERLDPDGAEPREEELRRQRRFILGREVDGLTAFSGLADPVNAALLRAAIAERTAPTRMPRFLDARDLEADGNAGSAFDAPVDPRLREQRAFDVVFGLLTAGIRADNAVVGSLHGTATVTAVIRAEDLARGTGVAWIDDVLSPIATPTTQELICDGGIRLQIEGSKGEILWEGRRERYFTPPQRRALGVRDGGCIWPDCSAPPSWCHAHHVVEWEHGGPTDVDNGALLCSFHHHLLHSSEYRVRMVDGLPELQRPFGDREWTPVTKSRLRLALTA